MEPKEVPEVLPPPPPVIPPNVVPIRFTAENVPEEPKKTSSKKLVPMARRDVGSRGKTIELLCNHFKVTINNADDYFYHYSVSLSSGDGRPVNQKGIGRKLIDKVRETYYADLAGKDFAYDGANSLFTIGSLRSKRMEFTVLLDNFTSNRDPDNDSPKERDKKRTKRAYRSKTFKVSINYAARIPIHAMTAATRGRESENSQEALRVLDIILRQRAAKQGCLLVRQSFFHNDPRSLVDLGGGVHGCRGFHSSFRVTQAGLSLNMDGSTTTIIMPGPLIDFLLANQNVSNSYQINWGKAKRTLKNLLIKVSPSNQEYKINGISENRCREEMFSMKSRNNDQNEVETVDITVYNYYLNYRNMDLRNSADLPCINVGKPKRPVYIPVELCSLLPLQRYTKALSVIQRAELVEKSRQKPQEKMNILTAAMERNDYDAEPMLQSCGITISTRFSKVEGRVLSAPMLKVGNGEDFIPRNGRWNFNNKQFFEPVKIEHWAVVNFSARCDNVRGLCRDLRRFGEMKGILISSPAVEVIEESAQVRRFPPPVRVEKMFEQLKKMFPKGPPTFILCLLPEKKNSELYGPWKRKSLAEFGIFTQCLAPGNRAFNEQYITNILLKINAKVGGFNSLLPIERIPLVSQIPTIIFGMDVSHGTPGQADMPSIAAVVSSRNWPQLSCYRASVRSQSPKVEMIDSLFKPTEKDGDTGIVRELLKDFYLNSHKAKPAHIVVFRDGVSESQFSQVLNVELDQIIKACEFLDRSWSPKFTLIVAQKNHHTKFFKAQSSQDNVPPGTIIDNSICHPHNNDFYLCAHAGAIGTTRPTHYHVLLDEVGFTADDLQELVHSLSYVYQRSTTAISVVAPIRYAHLAAAQSLQFLKFDNLSSKASSDGGTSATSSRRSFVPELPVLHQKVGGSMFFC